MDVARKLGGLPPFAEPGEVCNGSPDPTMPLSQTPAWIDLNRSFLLCQDTDELAASPEEAPLDWQGVLSRRCSVILGEAGTGKTSELRERALILRQQERAAFFLPVEEVGESGVAGAIDPSDAKRFRAWRDSGEEGWLLLDAVDESKLRGHKLRKSLRAIIGELGDCLGRLHVILSSRPSDWGTEDGTEIAKFNDLLVDSHEKAGKEPERPCLLRIAPLEDGQVSRLVSHYGAEDATALLGAVRDTNSWMFAERPLDVRWLVGYWNAHKKLGSLREMLDFNIGEKLKEKRQRPTLLSQDKARDGARRLACAATLSRTAALWLPDEEASMPHDALDPREVLSEWSPDEIGDLLARGLFDEATYGRVRFHHRSVREFLAAEHLRAMRDAGLARSELERLLFPLAGRRTVVPRHLAPVVAWLALDDESAYHLGRIHAPEHLVDEGDPSGFPPEKRQELLLAYAERFRDRGRIFHHFDRHGLRRFACLGLAGTVRGLLLAADTHDHLRAVLLRLVEVGPIPANADAALDLALAPTTPQGIRIQAIKATAKAGTHGQRQQLLTLVGQPSARDRDVACVLLRFLFPEEMTASTATALLHETDPPAYQVHSTLEGFLSSELPKRLSPEQWHDLHTALLDALCPTFAASGKVDPQHVWLLEHLASACASSLGNGLCAPSNLAETASMLEANSGDIEPLPHERLLGTILGCAALRREIFWRRAEKTAGRKGRFPRFHWELGLGRLLPLRPEDAVWLEKDCLQKNHVRGRLLAFGALIQASPGSLDIGGEKRSALESVVSRSDAAHGGEALATHWKRWLVPRSPPLESIWDLRIKMSEQRRARQREQVTQHLRESAARLAEGDPRLLRYTYAWAVDKGGFDAPLTTICEAHGEIVANAARAGFSRFWRAQAPPLLHTQPNPPPIHRDSLIGLFCIGLDEQDGTDMASLPPELLERAVTYASWSLNGFPAWLGECAARSPDVVRRVFAPALRLDYGGSSNGGQNSGGRLLGKLPWARLPVQQACSTELADLLRAGDPLEDWALADTLAVVSATKAIPSEEMRALAVARTAASAGTPRRLVIWWCAWAACDIPAAVSFLEGYLGSSAAPAALVELLCSTLGEPHDKRYVEARSALRSEPNALANFALLAYTYFPRSTNGPHHWDDAEEFRDGLWGWLSKIPGEPTVVALDRLSGAPVLAHLRDWLRHLADERAAEDAAGRGVSAKDVARFLRTKAFEPVTTADLFRIALARLEDIRDNLAHGDFSVRASYNQRSNPVLEEPVQNFLAGELEHRRNAQYAVVREAELTRKVRPDIRLLHQRCRGPVTIEIKIAERWKLEALEESLRAQLVGSYMRANGSGYGIFVVCSSGPRKPWKDESGQELDFQRVLERLRALASRIAEDSSLMVAGLEVVGIDFHE